eukprot:g4376.t1
MTVFIPAHVKAAYALAEEENIIGITKLFREHVDDVQLCDVAMRLIWQLVMHNPGNKKLANDHGILDLISESLEKHGEHAHLGYYIKKSFLAIVQNYAALELSNTKRIKMRHRMEVVDNFKRRNFYVSVIGIMRQYPDQSDMQELSCAAIGWLMVTADEVVRSKCMQLGGLNLCEMALAAHGDSNPHVARYARWSVDLLREAKARFEFDLQMKREEEERKKMIERMVQANRSKYTMGKKAKNAGGVDYYADI